MDLVLTQTFLKGFEAIEEVETDCKVFDLSQVKDIKRSQLNRFFSASIER